jgi:hypothetical protein
MIVAIQKDLAGFIQTVRRVRLSSHCPLGFQARTSWGPQVRFRRVQTLVRERSPLVKAAQFCLGGLVASPVTATTDFLAPDTLNRCGRAVPAPSDALHRTLRPIAEVPSGRAMVAAECPFWRGYCSKSRKSDNPKNLAKVDLWASLLLRRFSTPLRRSVIDLDETIWSLTSSRVKRISGSKNFRSPPQKRLLQRYRGYDGRAVQAGTLPFWDPKQTSKRLCVAVIMID